MQVLSELWYGNIAPHERDIRPNSEYKRQIQKLSDYGEQIRGGFSPEQRQMFDEYENIYNTINARNEEESFVLGFRLGARMMLEVLEER